MGFTLFAVLISLVSVLLILIILVQNPKGGGLSSTFGGSSQQMIGSVAQTNNFLDKTTWTLAGILVALSFISALTLPQKTSNTYDELLDGEKAKAIEQTQVINNTEQNVQSIETLPIDSTK